ncbi:hypothetical protein [Blastococcus atacamensis]|uniref:hypothetical protein n=1 Tax=Blastococcus atacamensis TaxID=2070508 RepID=UPI000CEBB5C3|nr:hypothetical protein [Blastococcus atacamensis]
MGTTSSSTGAQRRRAVGAALVAVLAVAYPLLWGAGLAHAEFSGCWLSCGGDPRFASGVAWTTFSAVLLGIPLAAGLLAGSVRSWVAWAVGVLLILLAATAWVMFSLDPGNAAFFVALG